MENKHLFGAALFDLDGVIFDTESQYTVFWGAECRRAHPELPGLEQRIKGSTLQQIFDRAWTGPLEKERQHVVERLDAFEAQMRLDYVEGFVPLLNSLRSHGVKTAVVTSSNQQKMSNVYSKHPEFRPMFDAILTSEDFVESKPSPDCYLRAAQRLGCTPRQCIVFEDSINGLRAGRAARMRVVGLLTTNVLADVAPLSDIQLTDYRGVDYETISSIGYPF